MRRILVHNPGMSDEPLTTNEPASEPADAEIEKRAIALARAAGIVWAAPGTPEQGAESQAGAASKDDRTRYRAMAKERLEAERGLVIP